MKKTAFLLTLCLVMTTALCACGNKDVSVQQTRTQDQTALDASVLTDETDVLTDEITQLTSMQENTFGESNSAQSGSNAAQTSIGGDSAAAQTTTGAADAVRNGETATVSTPNGAPAVSSGASERAAEQTTSKVGKSNNTVTSSASPAGESGIGSDSGNGAAADSTTVLATTESTTVYVPAEGQHVNAKMTYLKEAAVTYVSALNEDDLKRFNITGDKVKEILKNKNDWAAYTIQIDFRNDEKMPITIYYLDVTENGKGDVYVNGDLAGDLGLMPGAKMMERFYVLAKKNESDGSVLQKLQNMAMRIQYAATPEDDMVTPTFVYSKVDH